MAWGGFVVGIDTNILIRWLLTETDDPQQADRAAELIAQGSEPLLVSIPVVAECIWLARGIFRQNKAEIIGLVERLLAAPGLVIAERTAVAAALDSWRVGRADFTDHLIAALNIAAGCATTLTFDKTAAKGPHFTLLT